MKSNILFFFLLTSCFCGGERAIVQGPSPKKQKQKIAMLQKKLQLAEKEQKKVQTEIEKLVCEIDEVQLFLIRRQIDDYETKKDKTPHLFLQEREALYRMIQEGPSPSAFEAQVELDRILRIITELSDASKHI